MIVRVEGHDARRLEVFPARSAAHLQPEVARIGEDRSLERGPHEDLPDIAVLHGAQRRELGAAARLGEAAGTARVDAGEGLEIDLEGQRDPQLGVEARRVESAVGMGIAGGIEARAEGEPGDPADACAGLARHLPGMETPAARAHPGPQLVIRLDAARHDLDDTGQRIGAVDRGEGPAHDLDPVEIDQREGRGIEGAAPRIGRVVDAHPVDEDDDVVRIEAAQRELRPPARGALLDEVQARDEAQRIQDRRTEPEVEALARQDTRLEGCVADPVAHPRPRHDPFVLDLPLVP